MESLLVSILGGAAGCALAYLLLQQLTQWRAPLDFPVQFDVRPDLVVFAFSAGAAVLTGLLFGIAPARQAIKIDLTSEIKGSAPAGALRRFAMRDLLLPAQVALCCVLIIASFVALRGMARSLSMPLGIRPEGVAVAGFDLGLARYEKERAIAFQREVLERISTIPGVTSTAYANSVPLSIDQSTTSTFAENETDLRPRNSHPTTYYIASPGYFRTIGTRLIAGREFSASDNREAPPVAIINATLARELFGKDPAAAVGHPIRLGSNDLAQVIGVAEDGKYETLTEDPKNAIWFPVLQTLFQSWTPTTVVIARTSRPPSEVAGDMQRVIASLDPNLPVYGTGTLQQMLGLVYLPMRAAVIMLGAFGLLAVMLAITGVWGLAAYTVSRRTQEIGIRIAIGAGRGDILRLVLGRTALLVGVGSVLGLAAGVAASTALSAIVYQASSRDPVVIVSAALAMMIVAVVATIGPARRALRARLVQAL